MKYSGGKHGISKHLLPIVLKDRKFGQWYWEPFVGGCGMMDKVSGNRIGSDVNECLIACLDALSGGWIPPESISREFYSECRIKYNKKSYSIDEMKMIGYVGINGSYGGRYYDGGYAGITTTNQGKIRNYPAEAFKNVMNQAPKIKGVDFISGNYLDMGHPDEPCIIYCDPPYANTKSYIEASKSGFHSIVFWQWCRHMVSNGHQVFISEYEAPDDFVCVWQKEVKSSLSANGVAGGSKKSVEKLFIHESQVN